MPLLFLFVIKLLVFFNVFPRKGHARRRLLIVLLKVAKHSTYLCVTVCRVIGLQVGSFLDILDD